jgi:hypothetical protein
MDQGGGKRRAGIARSIDAVGKCPPRGRPPFVLTYTGWGDRHARFHAQFRLHRARHSNRMHAFGGGESSAAP